MSDPKELTYVQRMHRVADITSRIQQGNVDPSELLDLIQEARTILKQCSDELTHIEKELRIGDTEAE